MALQKQTLPINFAQGMDTKTDIKQLPLGKMYKITNGVYTSPLQLKKRNGYTNRGLRVTDGTSISNPVSLSKLENTLNISTSSALYSYSQSIDRWVEKGSLSNLSTASNPIIRNNYQQTKVCSASVLGVSAFAWKDNRGGCRFSIIDQTTGTVFLHDQVLTATGDNPKIIVNSNAFYIFFSDTAALKYRKIVAATPTTVGAEVTAKSNLDSGDPVYDLGNLNGRIYCGYSSSVGGAELQLFYMDDTDTIITTTGVSGAHPTTTVNIYIDMASRIIITYYDGTSLFSVIYNFSLTGQLLAPTTIETLANVDNVDLVQTSQNNYLLNYTITNGTVTNYLIRKNTLTYAGSVGTPAVFLRSVGQASKFVTVNNKIYSLVAHESTLQSTYFLVNTLGAVEAKIAPTLGGGILAENSLSIISLLSTSSILIVSQLKSQLVAEGGTFFSTEGVNSTVINFTPDLNYQDATLGKNLYITGGILRNYDGVVITEDGFFIYPEGLTAGTNAAGGGSLTNGTRQYIAVYAWYDNKGQLHRSAASIALSTTQAAGGSTQTQQVVIPTLRLSQKSNVIIELYRTETAGTIFYKVTSTTSPTFNNSAADTITITDGVSDTALISNEILYTTGGILDNDQAPNSSIMVNWKNRLWLAGLEDSQALAYSKELAEGFPAEFSDFLRLRVDDNVGPITAIAVLDDKLIIFKSRSMFVLSGNGPTAAGTQSDYGAPDRISSDVGCTDFNSIVITPDGLMFKSEKGIYLLNRGLTAEYIGYEVEEYNSLTINAATLIPDSNQIRFLTSGDVALVFDYFVKRWSVFSNHGGQDAEIIDGVYIYLRNDDSLFVQSALYLDNNEGISLQVDTGWLSFAGVQNFQRVYKLLALGEFKSRHKLKFEMGYNFSPATIQEVVVDSDSFVNSTTYGTGTYGSEAFFGGASLLNAYQLRIDMGVQKAQSIRVLITELQNDVYGEGLALSNLNFEIGVKTGLFKPNQSQTFGSR